MIILKRRLIPAPPCLHFTTFANDFLDAEYDTGASGTLALGPVSSRVNYTLPIKLRLTSTVSTAGSPGVAFTGGSYADQSIAGSMAAASAASKSNNATITFSGLPALTLADVMTVDSTGTPKNMNFRGGSSYAISIGAGDSVLFTSSNLTGTE